MTNATTMWYVICERLVKENRILSGEEDKYTPRTQNVRQATVSGPFEERGRAEEAAASAMHTHTCLAVRILSPAAALEIATTQRPGYLGAALEVALRQDRLWP
jgi:hypothetical protein